MVYMLIGIQGSGKSTYANQMHEKTGIEIISSDKIRQTFKGIPERIVWMFLYLRCAYKIRKNEDFILDATNISKGPRQGFFNKMSLYGLKPLVSAIVFDVDLETSLKRVEKRNQDPNELYLPLDVIKDYANRFEDASLDEGFIEIKHIKM